MKYGYKEIRTISVEDLRMLCVEKEWYTEGDNKEYANLLETAENYENITCDELVEMATDIKSHSETDYEIETIMYMIANKCKSYFEEA